LYQGSSDDSLTTALEPLLDSADQRTAMGLAGRLRVQQKFGLQSMVDGYLSLYDETLCAA
jgi:hypothetical protein